MSASTKSWLRRVVQIVRLLAFACALQLSGAAHTVVSLACGADAGCIDICDSPSDDGDEHPCPPGCPDCSCPHGRLPSLPPSLEPVLPEQLAWDHRDVYTPYHPGAPPSPPLPSLYRPPRA